MWHFHGICICIRICRELKMQILRNSQTPNRVGSGRLGSDRAVVGVGVEVEPGASTGNTVELFFLHFLFIWCGCVLSWTDMSNMRQAAKRCHIDWQLDKRTQNARARFPKRDRATYVCNDRRIDSSYSEEHAPSQHRPTVSQCLCFDTHFTVPPRNENQNQNENEKEQQKLNVCEWEWEWESKSKSKSKWKRQRQRKCDLLCSSGDCSRFLLEIW